jgi:hypothetical protein
VAKTVKIESLTQYQIHFSSILKKIFDIRPNIEQQKRVNLNFGPDIKSFFNISNKKIQYQRLMLTISNKTSILGMISDIMSDTMSSFDFLCLLQDQILSCVLPPAKNPTMIWLMNAQSMRMNALILLIKSLYHPLHFNCTRCSILFHTLSTYLGFSNTYCTRAAVAAFLCKGCCCCFFCGLHGDGTGLGEAHGLCLVMAQPPVKMNFVGTASEGQRT